MFSANRLTIFAMLAILTAAASVSAQLTIPGEVLDVVDGKTVLVAIPGGQVKVELQYIDVPEQGQQLSETVTAHLRSLVMGKSVQYRPISLLRDRAIGRLTIRDVDISQQMLRDGAAWHKPDHSGQGKAEYDVYASTEAVAKKENIGVWSIPALKPSWERLAEKKNNGSPREQYSYAAKAFADPAPKKTSGLPTGANPLLGNVGALANGYDPVSGNGYLGTSFLQVTELDKSVEYKTALDISYYYKQDSNNKRKGTFVFSIISVSKKWRFLERNNVTITGNGKDIVIGKAKRTTQIDGDDRIEKLAYAVNRAAMERLVNDDEAEVKIGTYAIKLTPGLTYLLYNLLQVTQ
jgi:endonuclease YncB( thermonuclease family)